MEINILHGVEKDKLFSVQIIRDFIEQRSVVSCQKDARQCRWPIGVHKVSSGNQVILQWVQSIGGKEGIRCERSLYLLPSWLAPEKNTQPCLSPHLCCLVAMPDMNANRLFRRKMCTRMPSCGQRIPWEGKKMSTHAHHPLRYSHVKLPFYLVKLVAKKCWVQSISDAEGRKMYLVRRKGDLSRRSRGVCTFQYLDVCALHQDKLHDSQPKPVGMNVLCVHNSDHGKQLNWYACQSGLVAS